MSGCNSQPLPKSVSEAPPVTNIAKLNGSRCNYFQRNLDINSSTPPGHKGMPTTGQQEKNISYVPNNN